MLVTSSQQGVAVFLKIPELIQLRSGSVAPRGGRRALFCGHEVKTSAKKVRKKVKKKCAKK
jgi:hypothetical protein